MNAPGDKIALRTAAAVFRSALASAVSALVIVWCSSAAFAQSPSAPTEDEQQERVNDGVLPAGSEPLSVPTATAKGESPVPPEPTTFVDTIHAGISTGLLTTAVWLDSFFGDERYVAESNQSHFKVSETVLFEDSIWTRYRPDYELRLVLPQLRKKTRLVISGDVWNDSEGPAAGTGGLPPPSTTPEDREFNTALQVVMPSHDYHSTTIRGGMKYHSSKFIVYGGPRYRYRRPLGVWTGRFTEDAVWFTDQGWVARTRFDLERQVQHEHYFFRASAETMRQEHIPGYLYSYTFLLRQPLDARRAIEYEWINSCQTRPVNELTEVKFVFRYRQQIWRKWLFLEIAPQYRFPRDRGFEETPGIIFKLEMIFERLHA